MESIVSEIPDYPVIGNVQDLEKWVTDNGQEEFFLNKVKGKTTNNMLFPGMTDGDEKIPSVSSLDERGLKYRLAFNEYIQQEVLDTKKIPTEYFGADNIERQYSVSGTMPKKVCAINPETGLSVRYNDGKHEAWAAKVATIIRLCYHEAHEASSKVKADSHGGVILLDYGITPKLAAVKAFSKGFRPECMVMSQGHRGQPDPMSKVDSRPVWVRSGKQIIKGTMDQRFSTWLKDNPRYKHLEGIENVDSLKTMRQRTVYMGDAGLNTILNAFLHPRRKHMYLKYGYTFKHTTPANVISKFKRSARGGDIGNWDQAIPHNVIVTALETFASIAPPSVAECIELCHRILMVGYHPDDRICFFELASLFNMSGWAFVSDLARVCVIGLLTTILDIGNTDEEMDQFLQGHGRLGILSEGDDVIITTDGSKDELDQIFVDLEQGCASMGVDFEEESVLTFRGISFFETNGSWHGFPKLVSYCEKIISPEHGLMHFFRNKAYASGHFAKQDYYKQNAYYHVLNDAMNDFHEMTYGKTIDSLFDFARQFEATKIKSFNAATLMFMNDAAYIYKNYADEALVDPNVMASYFFSFSGAVCKEFSETGDFSVLSRFIDEEGLKQEVFEQEFVREGGSTFDVANGSYTDIDPVSI